MIEQHLSRRLAELEAGATDAQALCDATLREIAKVTDADLVNAVNRLNSAAEASPAAVEAEARIKQLRAQLEVLRTRRSERQQTALAAQQTVVRCRRWLEQHPAGLRVAEVAPPQLGAGETVRDAIARLRREIGQADAAAHAARVALKTAAEMRGEAREWVAELAQQATPRLNGVRPSDNAPCSLRFGRDGAPSPRTALQAMAVFAPHLILAKCDELIAALPAAGALDDSERRRKLAAASAAKLDLEMVEEVLIQAAARDDIHIARRTGADPRAILQVREIATADKAAA